MPHHEGAGWESHREQKCLGETPSCRSRHLDVFVVQEFKVGEAVLQPGVCGQKGSELLDQANARNREGRLGLTHT